MHNSMGARASSSALRRKQKWGNAGRRHYPLPIDSDLNGSSVLVRGSCDLHLNPMRISVP